MTEKKAYLVVRYLDGYAVDVASVEDSRAQAMSAVTALDREVAASNLHYGAITSYEVQEIAATDVEEYLE